MRNDEFRRMIDEWVKCPKFRHLPSQGIRAFTHICHSRGLAGMTSSCYLGLLSNYSWKSFKKRNIFESIQQ